MDVLPEELRGDITAMQRGGALTVPDLVFVQFILLAGPSRR